MQCSDGPIPKGKAALGGGTGVGYGDFLPYEGPDSGGAWQLAGISVPGSPRRRRSLHVDLASLETSRSVGLAGSRRETVQILGRTNLDRARNVSDTSSVRDIPVMQRKQ